MSYSIPKSDLKLEEREKDERIEMQKCEETFKKTRGNRSKETLGH